MKKRTARIQRKTHETQIKLEMNLDGSGKARVSTGIPFLDHMLRLLAKHSLMDLNIRAKGDLKVDLHHTVEDVGIALGQGLTRALGDKRGIRRYGWALVPMDESLAEARVALDLGGRPYLVFKARDWRRLSSLEISKGFRVGLVREFAQAFASEARCNLHIELLYGDEPHHIVEAIFKALAKALDFACQRDERVRGVPSTKGKL